MISKSAVTLGLGLSLLVALTSWLAIRTNQEPNNSKAISALPVGIATHLLVKQMNSNGQLYYQLYADKASQYRNNWYNLLHPAGALLQQQNSPPWRFSAEYGKVYQDSNKIDLWNNVLITRASSAKTPPLELSTSAMRIDTLHKTAYTPYAVKFTEPGSGNVVTGVGMLAWLDSQTMKLFSKVDSYYEPTKTSP